MAKKNNSNKGNSKNKKTNTGLNKHSNNQTRGSRTGTRPKSKDN